jgi:hypothetical protein
MSQNDLMRNCLVRLLLLYLCAAMMLVTSCSGCAELGLSSLSADQIDSQVVDADTGAPLEGAIVVAHWELQQGSLTGDGLPCGAANVEEAVTGKDGRFHIAAWGPIKNHCGYMLQGEPMLYVFKWGYSFHGFSNTPGVETITVTHSEWNGRQMKLEKFANMDLTNARTGSYGAEFESLNSQLGLFISDLPGECNWKRVPMALRELHSEQQQFIAAGFYVESIPSNLIMQDASFMKVAPQCGSPRTFVQGLLK